MSRKFRVVTTKHTKEVYEVDLAGTADPEEVQVGWVRLVEGLTPVDTEEYTVLAWVEEIANPGQ